MFLWHGEEKKSKELAFWRYWAQKRRVIRGAMYDGHFAAALEFGDRTWSIPLNLAFLARNDRLAGRWSPIGDRRYSLLSELTGFANAARTA